MMIITMIVVNKSMTNCVVFRTKCVNYIFEVGAKMILTNLVGISIYIYIYVFFTGLLKGLQIF